MLGSPCNSVSQKTIKGIKRPNNIGMLSTTQFPLESPLKTPKTLIIFKFSKFSLFLYFCSNKRTGTSGNFTRPGRTLPFFPSFLSFSFFLLCFVFCIFAFSMFYFLLLLLGEAVHRRAHLFLKETRHPRSLVRTLKPSTQSQGISKQAAMSK